MRGQETQQADPHHGFGSLQIHGRYSEMIAQPTIEINSKWLPTPAGHVRFLCEIAGGGALFIRPGSARIEQINPQPSTAAAVIVGLQLAAAREVVQ
jgi:hypothetical protein